MNESCIFCKIVRGEIPAKEVARSDDAVVIHDVNPQAPLHLLVIPTRHVTDLTDFVGSSGDHEVGALFRTAAQIADQHAPGGYRLVANKGADSGQTVFHLHVHVLAGREMKWPPG